MIRVMFAVVVGFAACMIVGFVHVQMPGTEDVWTIILVVSVLGVLIAHALRKR